MQSFLFSSSSLLQNVWIIALLTMWTIPWKGIALWKAAKKNDTIWFIVLLLANTVGILDILYIYVFSKRKMK